MDKLTKKNGGKTRLSDDKVSRRGGKVSEKGPEVQVDTL